MTTLWELGRDEKCFECLEAAVKMGLFFGVFSHSIDIGDLKRIIDYFYQKNPWS